MQQNSGGKQRSTRCSVCTHPKVVQIDRDLLAMNGTLAEVGERYGVSQWALSAHGLNHLDGYNRSWAAMNREKKKKSAQTIHTKDNQHSRKKEPLCTISDFPIASEKSQPIIVNNYTSVESTSKESDTSVMSKRSSDKITNTRKSIERSIDDLILDHKIEITKLEHWKSLGKQVV